MSAGLQPQDRRAEAGRQARYGTQAGGHTSRCTVGVIARQTLPSSLVPVASGIRSPAWNAGVPHGRHARAACAWCVKRVRTALASRDRGARRGCGVDAGPGRCLSVGDGREEESGRGDRTSAGVPVCPKAGAGIRAGELRNVCARKQSGGVACAGAEIEKPVPKSSCSQRSARRRESDPGDAGYRRQESVQSAPPMGSGV